jgi:hypothetical protein
MNENPDTVQGYVQSWPDEGVLNATLFNMRHYDWRRLKLEMEQDQPLKDSSNCDTFFGYTETAFHEGLALEGGRVRVLLDDTQSVEVESGEFDMPRTLKININCASEEFLKKMEAAIVEACDVMNPEY